MFALMLSFFLVVFFSSLRGLFFLFNCGQKLSAPLCSFCTPSSSAPALGLDRRRPGLKPTPRLPQFWNAFDEWEV